MIEYLIHEYLGTHGNLIKYLGEKNQNHDQFGLMQSEISSFNPEIRQDLQ